MMSSVSSNEFRPTMNIGCGGKPDNTPARLQDNAAARQSPKETSAALRNSFGDLPRNPYGDPRQSDDDAKPKSGSKCCCPKNDNANRPSGAKPGAEAKKPDAGTKTPGDAAPPAAPPPSGNLKSRPAGDAGAAPASTEPAPTEPAPTEPAPTEPAPTEPAPTEPAPTEPAPKEPAATAPAALPPSKAVEAPAVALQNFPQGTERGEPAKIKEQLFEPNGNLDTTRLHEAAAKYDPRDVYSALIHASKYGSWDGLANGNLNLNPEHKAVQPTAEKAKEALVALSTWQDTNGKYSPIKDGAVPPIVFYDGPFTDNVGGYAQGGDIYVNNAMDKKTPGGLANTIYHELNHTQMSDVFGETYLPDGKISLELETITEFLVNEWSGPVKNSGYEQKYPDSFKKVEDAVVKMGNGDRDKGVELLRQAYFNGDAAALQMLTQYLPPTMDVLPTL